VVANVIQSYRYQMEAKEHAALADPLFAAAATAGLASWRFAHVVAHVQSPVKLGPQDVCFSEGVNFDG